MKGKWMWWNVWQRIPEATEALQSATDQPFTEASEEQQTVLEWIVCSTYDMNDLRCSHFSQKSCDLERVPSTPTGCMAASRSEGSIPRCHQPIVDQDPLQFGWKESEGGGLVAVWTTSRTAGRSLR